MADRLIRLTTALAVVAVACVAAIISYQHAYELVSTHGEHGLTARLLPFTVDGLIWAASMAVLDASRRNERVPPLAAWSLGIGIVATVGANLAHGLGHGPVGALVSAWPALALVGSFELLMMLIRSTPRASVEHVPHTAEHEPAPQAEHGAPPVAPDVPTLEHAVRERYDAGHSQRSIARDLKIDRRKVKRIVEQSAVTKVAVAGLRTIRRASCPSRCTATPGQRSRGMVPIVCPMRGESQGMLSPTPHYYEIMGRAAEIARALGSPVGGAEHLFLGMLHDGGWPVSAISGLVDLARAEAAVRGILDSPGYSPPPPPRVFVRNDYVRPLGAGVAVERGDSYLGVEHAFLAMIRNRETVPARALTGLADLDALDAAVMEAMNAPVEPHEDAVFLPEGQQLDSPLSRAIANALPEGATFGFNSRDGRTWIHVFGPGGSLGREVSREVLNTALVSLGRPGLDS